MKKLVAVLVLLSACSEVRVPSDAASSDARSLPSCIEYVNILAVHASDCGWDSWSCTAGRPGTARLEQCRVAIAEVSGQCAQIEELLVSESCAP